MDYAGRLALSVDRAAFVRANVFDLLVVVLPVLRPLRLLRLVTLLSVLNRHAGSSLRGQAVLDAERDAPGPPSTASATRCGGPSPR